MTGLNTSQHPCFNSDVRHSAGRVHLPVAPDCNLKCNYCNRDYDCVNESRPGVTSAILKPFQALRYLEQVVNARPEVSVVGLAGPGDPFANPELTLETLSLVRGRFPEMVLCVSTNGLNLGPYVSDLREIGVSHITLTINAVDVDVGARIYSWVRHRKRVYRGTSAAEVLFECQMQALRALSAAGLTVKVNAILIPGVNDHHIADVARMVADAGADLFNCMPMLPVFGTPFGHYGSPSRETVSAARANAGQFIAQVAHCARCRADAVGLLGERHTEGAAERLEEAARWCPEPAVKRDCVAVATLEGALVNEHLGQARRLAIYRRRADGTFGFLQHRVTSEQGTGPERWQALADVLQDCCLILTSAAGASPREVLSGRGIEVVEWTGLVADGLETLARGEVLRSVTRRAACGAGCSGGGDGC